GTIVRRFTFLPDQRRPAFRAMLYIGYRLCPGRSAREIHASDFRNDLATLFNIYIIAYPQVQPGDFVGVMKRSALDSSSSEEYRFKFSYGCDRPRSAYLVGDTLQLCA